MTVYYRLGTVPGTEDTTVSKISYRFPRSWKKQTKKKTITNKCRIAAVTRCWDGGQKPIKRGFTW